MLSNDTAAETTAVEPEGAERVAAEQGHAEDAFDGSENACQLGVGRDKRSQDIDTIPSQELVVRFGTATLSNAIPIDRHFMCRFVDAQGGACQPNVVFGRDGCQAVDMGNGVEDGFFARDGEAIHLLPRAGPSVMT